MITIRKLMTLPRTTRLRKTGAVLAQLELREEDLAGRRRYLRELAETLVRDRSLPQEIREIAESLRAEGDTAPEGRLRRGVNTLRHELNAFLGVSSADWDIYDEEAGSFDLSRRVVRDYFLFLEDLRSPFNVGAVFRSAESFGVRGIFVSPHTAAPDHPRARRASMSTTEIIPWERLSLDEALERVRAETAGTDASRGDGEAAAVFALETGGREIRDFPFPPSGLMIVGSEELGVSPEGLARADAGLGRVSIRTGGVKASLNVSVAAGIALHAWWLRS